MITHSNTWVRISCTPNSVNKQTNNNFEVMDQKSNTTFLEIFGLTSSYRGSLTVGDLPSVVLLNSTRYKWKKKRQEVERPNRTLTK